MEPPQIRALPGYAAQRVPDAVFGGEVYWVEAGPAEGPTLLLVHGLGDRGVIDWFPVLPELAEHHHVVAVDLPGFARSSKSDQLYSPAAYVRFLDETVRPRLAPGPFDLVGHSLGGAIALAYAGTHPAAVRRLVLVDAAAILYREAYATGALVGGLEPVEAVSGPLGDIARAVSGVVTQPVVDAVPDPQALLDDPALRARVLGSPGRIAALAAMLTNLAPEIAAATSPTLLLWGAEDRVAPVRTGRVLAARLADAPLVVLEGAGHDPMSSHPHLVAQRILGHLTGPGGHGPSGPASLPPPGGERRRVVDASNVQLTGAYDRIEVIRSRAVRLHDVSARSLIVQDSDVVIETCRLEGAPLALRATGSRIEMSGCDLSAPVGLESGGSELDLAGVAIRSADTPLRVTGSTRLVLSVSSLQTPSDTSPRFVHGTWNLEPGQTP